MSSERFSEDDLIKKGFVRDGAGVFVPVGKPNSSLVNKKFAKKTPMLDKALDQAVQKIPLTNAVVAKKTVVGLVGDLIPATSKMIKRVESSMQKQHNPKSGLFAKGRLKKGVMNKTEATYARHLEALKFSGEISQFWFEKIKLMLADNTSITIDFAILYPDGRFVFHDVKGAPILFQDDAKAKMKIAAEIFPFEFFVVYPRKQSMGGGWDIHQINPDKNK